ncbi:Telomere repeat-binding protein 3 [Raphanus sativus]|uniref:Telomere repeat-binding protein 3 isoform X2 n=1 Tax=Raphanus sativus TaxID=3726 RepID=A0A6J0K131_RAPSA|nr:telomere repeat-binding protein 3 isoform X2 [Raphanus sativus]KAJ4872990.1 Telomere repeat-binding protein 3 [Raphanus sativus]
MVFKRKLDCVSVGFDYPNIPKAPRSCRRKVINKRTDAMDLLASLAGKLLEECESSSSASSNAFEVNMNTHRKEIKQEDDDHDKKTCVVNSFSFPDDDDDDGVLERTPVCETKNVKCEEGVTEEETGGGRFEQVEATGGFVTDTCKLEEATVPRTVCGDGELKSPSCVDGSLARRQGNHTKLGRDDDDDEKLYSYHKFSNKFKSYRSPTIRRIRKSLSSQYWKQMAKDLGHYRGADAGVKSVYRKRKSCYGYNAAWQRETIYKRRRSSPERSSVVTSDGGGISSGSVSKLPEKRDSVKLSIKSFRIPELFIEVPETATVGSLKRTVMEAVSVLLSGGIRVGVVVHGKKVRDDKKTLSQTGISCGENLTNLGFTLEPGGPSKVHVPLCSQDPLVPIDPTNLSERSAAPPTLDTKPPQADDVDNNNHLELVPYQKEITVGEEEPSSDTRAIVPLPALEVEALAVVPLSQKPKRTELAQRRTRRPFSVTEVEALVQAVEELGTGRWRDVKLRAFESADHRTYVDLKDKWKTLVHTASISPQQRRGEPVPQELLDRVLRAYGYWSQRQGKHQGKGGGGGGAHKDADMNRGRVVESGVSV